MDHNHSKPEELADFPGEEKRKTSGGKRENDSFSLEVPVSLASLTPTEWTFMVSYMALLAGGMESKHKFWKTLCAGDREERGVQAKHKGAWGQNTAVVRQRWCLQWRQSSP